MAMENLLSSDGTIAQAEPGEYRTIKGAGYLYCKATAVAIAAYAILSGATPIVMEAATTTTATALGTGGGLCAIPQFAVGASEYFWAFAGPGYLSWDNVTAFLVLIANSTAGNLLYSTATAGVLDDTSAGSTIAVQNLVLVTTVTTQAATAVTADKRLSWTV